MGNPYDNAKAESFIKTLEQEQVHGREWRDLDALRADLTQFFAVTYNQQQLGSPHWDIGAQNGEASTELTGARELTAPSPQTPTPRFTILQATKLSLVSLSHVGVHSILLHPYIEMLDG